MKQIQWASAAEVARALGITTRSLRRRGENGQHNRMSDGCGHFMYEMPVPVAPAPLALSDGDAVTYNRAPEYARKQADKYIMAVGAIAELDEPAAQQWVENWNTKHPDDQLSMSRVAWARRVIHSDGASAVLAAWGGNRGVSCVRDEWYGWFRDAAMVEGETSARSCWHIALGKALQQDPNLVVAEFPSAVAFLRRMRTQEGDLTMYLGRKGRKRFISNRSFYIARDWSNVMAGQLWVGDHHQVDVAAEMPDGELVFPWLTAWVDGKSWRFVGWELRAQSPNTDSILMAFHRAGRDNPIPSDVYIDNGKDYRSRSVSGGTKRIQVSLDDAAMAPMTRMLGIRTHFAIPFNARAKIIERSFLTFKEWMSKQSVGYRGGNASQRPADLKDAITARAIMPFEELRTAVGEYITKVANMLPSLAGRRAGMCAQEIWDAEIGTAAARGMVRTVSADALALCCTRVYGPVTVRRGMVRDGELNVNYYDDSLMALDGVKVVLRRDPWHYERAWVIDARDGRTLCCANYVPPVPALVQTDIERDQLHEMLHLQRQHNRATRRAVARTAEMSPAEKILAMGVATAALNAERGYEHVDQPVTDAPVIMTGLEDVERLEKKRRLAGRHDVREFAPEAVERKRGTWDVQHGYIPAASAG